MNATNKYETFLRLFSGREEFFARQYKDGYVPTPGKFGESQLIDHLKGSETYGIYVLTESSMCNFFCIDLDIPKARLGEIDFNDSSVKLGYLKDLLNNTLRALHEVMEVPSNATLVEDSGGRGYHIWIFLDAPVAGSEAIRFYAILRSLIDEPVEFFPKQAALKSDKSFGNLIKLPLGVHRKYNKRSFFLDFQDGTVSNFDDLEESLDRLKIVEPLTIYNLGQILESVALPSHATHRSFAKEDDKNADRPYYVGQISYLSKKCGAVKKLVEMARRSEPFSHEEAFHFCNVLLSVNDSDTFIDQSLSLSYGENYDAEFANRQLEKIRPLYPTSCQTLRNKDICPAYCTQRVERQNNDELLPDTNPLSVWLIRSNAVEVPHQENAIALIRTPQNVQRAYWLLKQYHEHEDTLFYDPFDFDSFESDLQSNSQLASLVLDLEGPIQFAGYVPVDLPKKLTEDYQLIMRRMAYGSIYDQVLIQSVFNVISPILEAKMHEVSYGYRWNSSDPRSNRIFRDWRRHYPNFRNCVLERLRINPSGVHICCDIKGYYDHIDQEILISQLEESIQEQRIIEFLKSVVALWKTRSEPACGLPQGPAYARVLANFYLNQFDTFASKLTAGYFRYVDDFYLVFDSAEEAERGLHEIVNHLHSLGLSLSDDDQKKPRITSNSDETVISQSLDKIQYGILEETKHLSHLDQVRIESFYEAIKRQKVPVQSAADVVATNNALPSYLYSASQDITITAEYRKVVFDLIDYLVSEGWFYPKNLKKFFYRLIRLLPDNDERLIRLFRNLYPTHKVYFLLSLMALTSQKSELMPLLKEILGISLTDEKPLVYGTAIAIARTQQMEYPVYASEFEFAKKCISGRSYYAVSKWLGDVNLLSLDSETRKLFRDSQLDKDNELIRLYILRSLNGQASPSFLDERYITRVIEQSSCFSLLMIADYFSTLRTTTQSFYAAAGQLVRNPKQKQIFIRRLKSTIIDRQFDIRISEIENLRVLYEQIEDEELQRELLGAIDRIARMEERPLDSFERTHVMVEHYNECMLFENLIEGEDYKLVEVIPTASVADYAHNDISDLIVRLEDLSEKNVLSTSVCEVDTGRDELLIKYSSPDGFRKLDSAEFSVDEDESIVQGLELASQVYKKALYYRRILGASPLISLENLMVDDSLSNIKFRTIGKSLSPRFVISGKIFSASESDIAAQIGQLLSDLYYSSESLTAGENGENAAGSALEVFLLSLLNNLSAKDPAKRYSFMRFEYLVRRLSSVSSTASAEITDLFLVERLKSVLYRRNTESTSWRGICAATDDHIADILHAVPIATLQKIHYSPDYFSQFFFRRRLHYLTKQLLDLQANYSNFLAERDSRVPYLDMATAMLGLSIVATETFCAYRSIESKKSMADLIKFLELDKLVIGSQECNREIGRKEVAQVVAALGKLTTERDQFEPVHLSLGEIGIVLALSVFSYEKNSEDHLRMIRPESMDTHRFIELLNICLYRLPDVERHVCDLVEVVKEALRNGEDYALEVKFADFREDIRFICEGLFSILKLQQIKRRSGTLDTHMWPPTIVCKHRFGRKRYAGNEALSHLPLSNKFPSLQTKSSWDAHKKNIRTLVVPGDRLSKLVRMLKAGKFFGRKFSYLYFGRAMLLWDFSLSLIVGSALFSFDFFANQSDNQTLMSLNSVTNIILGSALAIMFGKMIVVDIRHWLPEVDEMIEFFKKS